MSNEPRIKIRAKLTYGETAGQNLATPRLRGAVFVRQNIDAKKRKALEI